MDCASSKAVLLAVFGDHADAGADRVGRFADDHRLRGVAEKDFAPVFLVGAEDRAQGLGAARTDQPGEAEDFAAPHLEAHVADTLARAQAVHAQGRLPGRPLGGGLSLGQIMAHHLADHRAGVTSAASWVATRRPSRRTVTRLAMRRISSMRWLM